MSIVLTFVDPRNQVVVRLQAPIGPARARAICQRVTQLLAVATGELACHVGGPVDLGLVDALLRLQVLARREGWSLIVHAAGPELSDLLVLVGLDGSLPEVRRGLQPVGDSEPGEQRRVEEVVHVGDLPL